MEQERDTAAREQVKELSDASAEQLPRPPPDEKLRAGEVPMKGVVPFQSD